MHIDGKIQSIRAASGQRLFFPIRVDGQDRAPDSAPTITVYQPNGTAIVTDQTMTMVPVENRGFLSFDSLTSRFEIGRLLTGGTSWATGLIRSIRSSGDSGDLGLVDVFKSFDDNETITDSADGSADANGELWSSVYYYDLDASALDLGVNHFARVAFSVDSRDYSEPFYFDVVQYPYSPLVTSRMIDDRHPDWRAARDEYTPDWTDAINAGHARVSSLVRGLGRRAEFIVVREQLFPIELAAVESEIARNLAGLPAEDRDQIEGRFADEWTRRPMFDYVELDDDDEIDTEPISTGVRIYR